MCLREKTRLGVAEVEVLIGELVAVDGLATSALHKNDELANVLEIVHCR